MKTPSPLVRLAILGLATSLLASAPAQAQLSAGLDLFNQFKEEVKNEINPQREIEAQALLSRTEQERIAQKTKEVELVKSIIGADKKIAGSWRSMGRGRNEVAVERTDADLFVRTQKHFVFADFNADGFLDLAVAVELPPPTIEPNYGSLYGDRALQVYLGQQGGQLTLFREGANAILNADEGGVGGDPFKSITFDAATQTISIEHFGGVSTLWQTNLKLRMVSGEMVLVGRLDAEGYDSGDSVEDLVDFTTGEKTTTKFQSKEKTKDIAKTLEPIEPLKLLSEVEVR